MAQEEIIFKISADTGKAEKETDSLEASLEAVNEAAENLMKTNKGLDASFEDVYGNVQPLSGRLGELEDRMYELALAGQQNTEEFKELQAEAVRYRQTLISVDKSVDQLAEQGRGLGAALQIGTTVTAGYGAIQGSMIALGIESESLEKSFVKLQAVQTILASLEQLKLSLDKQSIVVTKAKAAATWVTTTAQTAWTTATAGTTAAMGALKVAMLAIPLVALLAGIVALAMALKDLASATEVLEDASEKLNDTLDKNRRLLEASSAAAVREVENRLKLAQARGESAEEIHKLESELMDTAQAQRKKDIKLTKIEIENKRRLLKAARKAGEDEMVDSFKEEIKASRERYNELKIQDKQYYTDKQIAQINYEKQITEEEQKAQDERASNWQKASEERKRKEEEEARLKLERARTYTDLFIENIADQDLRELTKLKEQHKRQRDELIKKHGEDTMLLKQLSIKQIDEEAKLLDKQAEARQAQQKVIDDKAAAENQKRVERERVDRKSRLEAQLIETREDFEANQALQIELAQIERDRILNDTETTEGEKLKVKAEYAQKLEDLEQAATARQLAEEEARATAVKNLYDSSFSAISNLSEGIFANRIANAEKGSKKELELQRKAFKINKAFQISQATMQGIQGVQNAFTTAAASPFGIANPWYPYAQATAAGVFALGNIAKIKASTFQGGGSLGTTSVTPPTINTPTDIETDTDTTTLTEGLEGSGNTAQVITIVDIKTALDNSEKVEVISTVG